MWTLKDSKPSTVGEVRKLLGLLGYYRRYIQDFARIAHPLFQLLQAASEGVAKSHKSKQRYDHGSVPSSRCGRNSIRKLLKHCWTTSYLLQFLAILISVSPLYYILCITRGTRSSLIPETGWENSSYWIWLTITNQGGKELFPPFREA